MKNCLLLISLFLLNVMLFAQPCTEGLSKFDLNVNNIRPLFGTGGDMFGDDYGPGFDVNGNTTAPKISTINFAALWMTATNENQERKLSVQKNRAEPLSYLPYGKDLISCFKWDRPWQVFKTNVEAHIADWNDNHVIDTKINKIYGWPGKANPYFFAENGFNLPTGFDQFAPFFDNNNDGIYNPDDGDYPALIDPKSGKVAIPDQMWWWMFDDKAVEENTLVKPLGMVIQQTAWAFNSTDQLLQNTIFTNHRLIYQGTENLKDFKSALYVNFDLGCGGDDYIGCSKDLSTMFAYNSDSLDGTDGIKCSFTQTFKNDPGVQAVTFLSDSMYSFTYGVFNTAPITYPAKLYPPKKFDDYVNYFDTKNLNGTHLLNQGNGTLGTATDFAFDGNPNNPNEWSMKSALLKGVDLFGLGSIYFGDLNPGDIKSFTTAYSYFNNPAPISTASDLDSMYVGVKRLRGIYDNFFGPDETATHEADQGGIVIAPNPASSQIILRNDKNDHYDAVIIDLFGRTLLKTHCDTRNSTIDISSLQIGTYVVLVQGEGQRLSRKLIVMR